MDRSLHDAREEGRDLRRRAKDGGAFAQLGLAVPGSHDVVRADERRGFGHALKESDHFQMGRAFGGGGDRREAAPDDHVEGEEDPRRNDLQEEVLRDLGDRVPDREARVDLVEVVPRHAERFLHAGDVRIRPAGRAEASTREESLCVGAGRNMHRQVRSVEIVAPIHQADEAEYGKVDLAEKPCLGLCFRRRSLYGWPCQSMSALGGEGWMQREQGLTQTKFRTACIAIALTPGACLADACDRLERARGDLTCSRSNESTCARSYDSS